MEVKQAQINTSEAMVTITGLTSFDLCQILECGQCFRFEKLDESEYKVIAYERVITLKQEGDRLTIRPCTEQEFNDIWFKYFDLDRDYENIKSIISKNDDVMAAAIAHAPGIRVLNQEFWEMCISFIISQNNRIPMIKKVIENLSVAYGKEIEGGFAFPKANALYAISAEELMVHKTGFRAKYIKDATDKYLSGVLDEKKLRHLTTEDARKQLLSVYGIGNKVADCIMLFGMGRTDVFPADVWITRVISELYFGGKEIPLKQLQTFAADKWGENAGLAQQYLFHYARLNKIGA